MRLSESGEGAASRTCKDCTSRCCPTSNLTRRRCEKFPLFFVWTTGRFSPRFGSLGQNLERCGALRRIVRQSALLAAMSYTTKRDTHRRSAVSGNVMGVWGMGVFHRRARCNGAMHHQGAGEIEAFYWPLLARKYAVSVGAGLLPLKTCSVASGGQQADRFAGRPGLQVFDHQGIELLIIVPGDVTHVRCGQ